MSELRRKIEAGEPELQLGSVWYCTATSSRFPAHYHDDLELNVVERGWLRYRVEGVDYEVGESSRIWLWPGALHELTDMSRDAAFWVFTCKAQYAGGRMGSTSEGARVESSASREQARALSELGCTMIRTRRLEVANDCLRRLLSTPWRAGPAPSQPRPHPMLARATALLEDVNGALSIHELAERCGVSHEHFTRQFACALGVPPVYYRNHQRVQAAIQLVETQRTNLLHAALQVGFGSYAQFHRAFVQVTADSPRVRFASREERHALPARVSLLG